MIATASPLSTILFAIATISGVASFLFLRRSRTLDTSPPESDPEPPLEDVDLDFDEGQSVASPPVAPSIPSSQPPAGWYPKPDDPYVQGYWDGTQWVSRVRWDGAQWVTLSSS